MVITHYMTPFSHSFSLYRQCVQKMPSQWDMGFERELFHVQGHTTWRGKSWPDRLTVHFPATHNILYMSPRNSYFKSNLIRLFCFGGHLHVLYCFCWQQDNLSSLAHIVVVGCCWCAGWKQDHLRPLLDVQASKGLLLLLKSIFMICTTACTDWNLVFHVKQ